MTDDPSSQPTEPTVRQLLDDPTKSEALDASTLAELHRWFGLPSAMDLPPEPETPESEQRRNAALAAVDPGFLGYLTRIELRLERMMEAPDLALRPLEQHLTVPERFHMAGRLGDPREVEIPFQLEDDLKECAPQALLRDLHRTEEYFERYFEVNLIAEPIPNVRHGLATVLAQGRSDRRPMSMHAELRASILERIEVRNSVRWETLARPRPDPEQPTVTEESP
jgi:hypothetical protein